MTTALDILIRARDEASAVINRVSGAGKQLGSQMQGVGDRMKATGATMTRTLTPAAAGAALVFANAGQKWDAAVRTLRAGNPAAVFESLMTSAKKVGGQVTQPLDQVASALDMVSDRTGATGKPLEVLTKKFLDLEHLTGESAASTIPSITRMFGDWSIATGDQSETMDQLLRLSEATGISVGSLSATMVQFGSPLRNLGIDMETAAAMFARFEKEGVNTQTIMPGLKMALKNFAAAGKDPQKALMDTFNAIKNASSVAEANTISFETFGARAGPDLAAAIREGRFELDELKDEMVNGKGTIDDSVKASESLADKFAKLKNSVMQTIGPFGDVGAAIFGVVAGIGPALMGFGQLIPILGKVKLATLASLGIWLLVAAAIIALVIVVVKNWDKIKAFLIRVWNAIKKVAMAVWNGIKRFFIGVFNFYKTLILGIWNGIKAGIVAIWNGIKTFARAYWNGLKLIIVTPIKALIGLISGVWGRVKDGARTAWNGVKDIILGVWDSITGGIRAVLNGLIGILNTAIGGINTLINGYNKIPFAPNIPNLPPIPTLDMGGIVSQTGLAVVHRGEVFSGVNRDFGPFGRGARRPAPIVVQIDRRHWVEQTEFETQYRGF